jgi:hypothetical protein
MGFDIKSFLDKFYHFTNTYEDIIQNAQVTVRADNMFIRKEESCSGLKSALQNF